MSTPVSEKKGAPPKLNKFHLISIFAASIFLIIITDTVLGLILSQSHSDDKTVDSMTEAIQKLPDFAKDEAFSELPTDLCL
ncbi:unnamed protein product [Caenorhabditis angaria]|uniref:Uncharacterized protein n=1 Tax=Caenorhabditis angaria TaxID=860376 RepID=A0A9P1ILE2_9PELO|nr:unnamed protein product [Caenorhabditis angaria]